LEVSEYQNADAQLGPPDCLVGLLVAAVPAGLGASPVGLDASPADLDASAASFNAGSSLSPATCGSGCSFGASPCSVGGDADHKLNHGLDADKGCFGICVDSSVCTVPGLLEVAEGTAGVCTGSAVCTDFIGSCVESGSLDDCVGILSQPSQPCEVLGRSEISALGEVIVGSLGVSDSFNDRAFGEASILFVFCDPSWSFLLFIERSSTPSSVPPNVISDAGLLFPRYIDGGLDATCCGDFL